MNRETKTFTAEIKAAPTTGPDAGTFTAVVSVFGNVDLGGDRVMPGAFTASLNDWATKGDPIPVIWSHNWDDPFAHIGYVESAKETEQGLEVKARLDVDRDFAAQVHHLLVSRRVTQFSFGYFTKDAEMVEDPDFGSVREIRAADLFEVGPTLLGMNPATQLLEAASATRYEGKVGRVLSSKNEERIRAAYDALGQVLTTITAETPKAAAPTVTVTVSTAADTGPASVTVAEGKATADEVQVGTFVEWDTSGGTARGKVEEIITDGTYEVPDTDFVIEASQDDPALAIRVYRSVRDGYVAGNVIVGHKASTVRVIDDLPEPSPAKNVEALLNLLTKTRAAADPQ